MIIAYYYMLFVYSRHCRVLRLIVGSVIVAYNTCLCEMITYTTCVRVIVADCSVWHVYTGDCGIQHRHRRVIVAFDTCLHVTVA